MARYSEARRRGRDRLSGKEIFDILPVLLGGNPTDPANKAELTRQQHIEAVRYWNRVISDLRKQQSER